MTQERPLVRDRQAMLAGMTPVLKDGAYLFCSTADPAIAAAALPDSIASFREAEGIALVMAQADAAQHCFDTSLPMAWIELQVYSALDGVGLTAAVASALADAGIPCNMIAAYHHDHVFVPAPMAAQAMELLLAVQRSAAQ